MLGKLSLFSVEDELRWKMAFGGRRPSVDYILWWKESFSGNLHTAYSALRHLSSDNILTVPKLNHMAQAYSTIVVLVYQTSSKI